MKPGEVWFAELGMVEKSRPVLLLAVPSSKDARSLVVVAPLTSQIRGLPGEVTIGKPRWLPKLSAVNVKGLSSFDPHRLSRKMGALTIDQMNEVNKSIRVLLDL